MLGSTSLVNKYKFIVVFSGLLAGLSHTVQAYEFNSGGGAAVEISGVVAIPDGRGLRKLRVILPKGSHHSYDQGHYPILRQGGKADNSRVFRFCQPGSPLAPESSETCQSILLLSRSALEIEVRDETEAVAGDTDLVSILAGSFVQLLNSAGAYLPFRPKPPELPDPGVSLPGNSPAPMNGNPGNPDVPSFPPGWPGQNPRFLLDTKNSPSLLELFPQPVMVQQNGPEAEWQGENAEEAVLTHFDARGGFARVQVPQDYKLVDPLQMQPEQPVRSLGFQPQAIEQRLPGGVLTEAVNSQGDTVYIIRESNGQIRILSPSQMANLMASVAYSKLEAAGLGDVNYVEFKDITRPYTRPVPDQPPLKGKKPRGEPDNPSAGPVFEPETKGGGGSTQAGQFSAAPEEVVKDKAVAPPAPPAPGGGVTQTLRRSAAYNNGTVKKQEMTTCENPFRTCPNRGLKNDFKEMSRREELTPELTPELTTGEVKYFPFSFLVCQKCEEFVREKIEEKEGKIKEKRKEKQGYAPCDYVGKNPTCLKEVNITESSQYPNYAFQYVESGLKWCEGDALPPASISLSRTLKNLLLCEECVEYLSGRSSGSFALCNEQQRGIRDGDFMEATIQRRKYTIKKSTEGVVSLFSMLSNPNPIAVCQLRSQALKAGIEFSHELTGMFLEYFSEAVERQAQTESPLIERVAALEQALKPQASQQTASNHTANELPAIHDLCQQMQQQMQQMQQMQQQLDRVDAEGKLMRQKVTEACLESVSNLQTIINVEQQQSSRHHTIADEKFMKIDEQLVFVEAQLERLKSPSQTNSTTPGISQQLSSLERSFTSLDVRLAEHSLRLDILTVKSTNGVLVWKLASVQLHMRQAASGQVCRLNSQPFYTSPCGYKMCASLYLNGDGMGRGTHLSLFFVVMRGEYDALLPWPFRQTVTLMLMNQAGGQHISDIFRPNPGSPSFQRPRGDMNIASGCPLFVPLTVLGNGNYIRNNCIFIKVVVETNGITAPDARP